MQIPKTNPYFVLRPRLESSFRFGTAFFHVFHRQPIIILVLFYNSQDFIGQIARLFQPITLKVLHILTYGFPEVVRK